MTEHIIAMDKHHLLAMLEGIEYLIEILYTLPQTDAVVNAQEITETLSDITCEVSRGRHYGDSSLETFINYIKAQRANLEAQQQQ